MRSERQVRIEIRWAVVGQKLITHALMKRMHKPGEEKRMVAILDPKDYMGWLTCPLDRAKAYLKPWNGVLLAEPAPLARAPKAAPEPPPQDELF